MDTEALHPSPILTRPNLKIAECMLNTMVHKDDSAEVFKKPKANLCYTRGSTPKRVTWGGMHLRYLVPGQHSSEKTSQRWRTVGDTVSDLTDLEFEPHTSRTNSSVSTTKLTSVIPPPLIFPLATPLTRV